MLKQRKSQISSQIWFGKKLKKLVMLSKVNLFLPTSVIKEVTMAHPRTI